MTPPTSPRVAPSAAVAPKPPSPQRPRRTLFYKYVLWHQLEDHLRSGRWMVVADLGPYTGQFACLCAYRCERACGAIWVRT